MPARKRKVNYPPPRTATRPAPSDGLAGSPAPRPTVVTIDLTAATGRSDVKVGDRVRLAGSGLYSGEIAVVEKLVGGVIPSAFVRTEAGRTRQVRTVDLVAVGEGA